MEKRAARRARQEASTVEQAREIAAVLERTELRFDVKAGPTGSLFGSVTATDLADEIWRVARVRVDRRKIGLDDPIKKIGRYAVPVEIFTDVTVDVTTLVVPEGGELPPEEPEPSGGRRDGPAGGRRARTTAGRRPPEPTGESRAEPRNEFSTGPVKGLGIFERKGRYERPFHPPPPSGSRWEHPFRSASKRARAARVDDCVVQALFGRVRRWLICPRCTNLPRLRRPPRSHRRISTPRSRSWAR